MGSSRDRQRKLARAKLDRQMARRAAATRRRRQIQAGIGASVALLLIVLGSVWALGGFEREKEAPTADSPCAWTPQDATANTNLKDVGTPPTTDIPTSGTRPMTIATDQGSPVTVELDLENAPCAGASFAHLASRNYFDNTRCHEITAEGAVRCGDPSGSGLGGPTYTFFDENVPAAAEPTPSASPDPDAAPLYPRGTVAMIGSPPGANGSQFLLFFKDFNPDQASYPVIGRVTEGQDVIDKIGSMETVDNDAGEEIKPKQDVVIQSLTVGDVVPAQPLSSGVPTTAATATPTGSPSAAVRS